MAAARGCNEGDNLAEVPYQRRKLGCAKLMRHRQWGEARSFSASAPEPSRRRAQQAGHLGDRQRGLAKTKAPPSMTKEGFFERRVQQITRCIIPGLRSATEYKHLMPRRPRS